MEAEERNVDKIYWVGQSSGHKAITLLLSSVALMFVFIIGGVVSMQNDKLDLSLVFLVLAGIAIVGSLILCVLTFRSELRWQVSNLLFTMATSGFYFNSTNNPSSYFFAKWSEIKSYSVTLLKNGKANVTVNLDGVANAGSNGRIKRIKMIGISDAEGLSDVFKSFGIEMAAGKS